MDDSIGQCRIEFQGDALETHDIDVEILANSLLALRLIINQTNLALNGKESTCSVKVHGGFQPGSFIVEIMAGVLPIAGTLALAYPLGSTIISNVVGLIQLYLWAKGHPIETDSENVITNYNGETTTVFNNCIINLYRKRSLKNSLDMLTAPLDADGVTSITLDSTDIKASITKQDRTIFRREAERIISDTTSEMLLYIVSPMLNGDAKGWKFSDGDTTFTATVEDETFLSNVRDGNLQMKNGDSILVVLQTTQYKKQRILTERSILEVLQYNS